MRRSTSLEVPVQAVTALDWAAAQRALSDEVARVAALLRSVRDPAAPAVGEWNLAEVAMHLSQVFVVVPGLAREDLSRVYEAVPNLARRDSGSLIGDLWDLGDVTTSGVQTDLERDPRVLADRIEGRAGELARESAGASAQEPCPWLVEGVTVPRATLTYHLLSETIMHGRDIALADGRKWPIQPSRAAMVVDGFLVPVVAALGPRTMVDQEKAAGLRACYEIHVRHGGRHRFLFEDGALTIDGAASARVDCHLSVDPVAFLLVAWGRMNQWRAIARGQLLAWGRKPWLGPRFRALIRNP